MGCGTQILIIVRIWPWTAQRHKVVGRGLLNLFYLTWGATFFNIVGFTMSISIFSFIFIGTIANYTFLEALISMPNPKTNVSIFSAQPMAAILDFQNHCHGITILAIFSLLLHLEYCCRNQFTICEVTEPN